MIKELSIESIRVTNGFAVADMRLKTENGPLGISVSMELRKEEAISAAVNLLENAIEEAMVKNMGIITPTKEPVS